MEFYVNLFMMSYLGIGVSIAYYFAVVVDMKQLLLEDREIQEMSPEHQELIVAVCNTLGFRLFIGCILTVVGPALYTLDAFAKVKRWRRRTKPIV